MLTEQRLQRGNQLYQQGRYKEAEKHYKEVLQEDPNDFSAMSMLCLNYSELGNFKMAAKIARDLLALFPENDYVYYLNARVEFLLDNFKEAHEFIDQAIQLDPNDADYFALKANIFLYTKNWESALQKANEGLAIDPENVQCLNLRSTALVKLGKKAEGFDTIREALNQDPNNSHTHANFGWGLLEKGQVKESLQHFKMSLSLQPGNEWARSGLVEALKARYWFYRMFLRYSFWVSNLKGKTQWMLLILFVFAKRILILFPPLFALAIAFALSTWLVEPLSNLLLRLNYYGRHALTEEERKCSSMVGVSLAVGAAAGLTYFIVSLSGFLTLCIVGISFMIPLSAFYSAPSRRRLFAQAYIIALGGFGAAAVVISFITGEFFNSWVNGVYVIGLILFQWIVNAMLIKS